MLHLLANLAGELFADTPLDPMTTLRHTLHLTAAQLLLTNLADIIEADRKSIGQLAKADCLTLVSLQNATAQIVRNRFRHRCRDANSRAEFTLRNAKPIEYSYLDSALKVA